MLNLLSQETANSACNYLTHKIGKTFFKNPNNIKCEILEFETVLNTFDSVCKCHVKLKKYMCCNQAVSLLGLYLTETHTCIPGVYSRTIHNSKKLEITKVPINKRMDK